MSKLQHYKYVEVQHWLYRMLQLTCCSEKPVLKGPKIRTEQSVKCQYLTFVFKHFQINFRLNYTQQDFKLSTYKITNKQQV